MTVVTVAYNDLGGLKRTFASLKEQRDCDVEHIVIWNYDISQQAVFVRTDVLREFGGFDERFSIAADYHAITRLGQRYNPRLFSEIVARPLAGGISDRR